MTEHPPDDEQVSTNSTKTLSAGPSLRRLRRAPRAALQAALKYGQPPMDEHAHDNDDDHPQGPPAPSPRVSISIPEDGTSSRASLRRLQAAMTSAAWKGRASRGGPHD